MKKIFMFAGVMALIASTSCVNKAKTDDGATAAEEQEQTETVEKPAAPAEDVVAPDLDNLPANIPEPFVELLRSDTTLVVLPSGLIYKVEAEGEGNKPTAGSDVLVMYTGKHINGEVFDQSHEPVTFNLGQVIAGFSEGIMQMNRGAKYTLYIPSDLGYGERGAGNIIAPNEPLIFDIELIDFM